MQNVQLKNLNRNKLLDSAFTALFDVSPLSYNFEIKYSGRFKDYNANVSYKGNWYKFNLSKEWVDVGQDIVVGLIQYLMIKAFEGKLALKSKVTLNIELYNQYLKEVHKYAPKTNVNLELKKVFDRVNEKYFLGNMDVSNLVWGKDSIRTLGHYSYGSDTITISSIFKMEGSENLIDFVMYHEMLHKRHKYSSSKTGRNLHHSPAFREDEKKFEGFSEIDSKLNVFIRNFKRSVPRRASKPKLRNWFGGF